MKQNPITVAPPEPPPSTGVHRAMISASLSTSAAAAVIALLYLVFM